MTGYNPSAAITSFGGAFPCRPMNPYGLQAGSYSRPVQWELSREPDLNPKKVRIFLFYP